MSDDLLDIEYSLHVELVVPTTFVEEFEDRVVEFLNEDGFNRIVNTGDDRSMAKMDTKRLVLALKSKNPFVPKPGQQPTVEAFLSRVDRNEKFIRYVHVWSIEDIRELDLVRLMRLCAADDLYRKIDALVVDESQEFIVKINTPVVPGRSNTYVRSVQRFRSFDVGGYLFSVGALRNVLSDQGVYHVGQYQAVTGKLNAVFDFWNLTGAAGRATSPDVIGALKAVGLNPTLVSKYVDPPDRQPIEPPENEFFQPYLKPESEALAKAVANKQLDHLLSPAR
jgi:hypothetical protein